ncbi:Myb/SANT-like DNA-binding domain-containing protein, partial [Lyophyllum atratum]
DAVLLETLKIQKLAGAQAENGWKSTAWVAVVKALEEGGLSKPGNKKTAAKCSDHWGNLKASYVQVHKLRNCSGFGWDDQAKMVTATDDVWDAYLKSHKKAERWRKTPFPLYDDIHYLVSGIVATGAGAFH